MTEPYYADESVRLFAGDCLDVLRELPDASIDAVVTDPPYGLAFMGKAWDDHVDGARFGAWCLEWSIECLRVLKPGGHMLAFGGSRTWHRLACAVEDAGFELRDSIAWLYASGFPKSLDVSKAIDKQRTEDREPVDRVRAWLNERRVAAGYSHDAVNKHFGHASNGGGSSSAWMTNPTSRSLPTWDQWHELRSLLGFGDEMDAEVWRLNGRKGMPGEAWDLRPVTQEEARPLVSGEHISFDQRSSTERERRDIPATDAARQWQGWGTALKPAFEPIVVARKPLQGTVAANVTQHGTGALNIDACRVSGVPPSVPQPKSGVASGVTDFGSGEGRNGEMSSASGRWPSNLVLTHAPDCTPNGAPDGGLWACMDGCPVRELDRQSGQSASPGTYARSTVVENHVYGASNDRPIQRGHGDSGGASRFFPTFRYEPKAPTSERPRDGETAHPTVKPLDLMRWAVRLVTPPGGTVLDHFAGSGTTGEACVLEGFDCILIERERTYLPLIVQRLTKPLQPDLFGGAA